jgi:hypothetical protein
MLRANYDRSASNNQLQINLIRRNKAKARILQSSACHSPGS